ncbi:MAG: dTDP-4-dehydrorhamnose reductase, partial [Nocardioidaceae bacterium]
AGEPLSWRQIAAEVFTLSGRDPADVAPTTTDAYFADAVAAGKPISPRPLNSVLDLSKIEATGFHPGDHLDILRTYLA